MLIIPKKELFNEELLKQFKNLIDHFCIDCQYDHLYTERR